MVKYVFVIWLLIYSSLFSQPLVELNPNLSTIETVRYYYLGSYHAIVGTPVGEGPFQVIIYSYDEIYDWSGELLANRIGYNLEEIARYFSKRGYLCVIPLNRYRKINAIKGITAFLQSNALAKKDDIHLVGMSEGAFMNMIIAHQIPGFKSLVCVAPIMINDKGALSYKEFLYYDSKNLDLAVMFLFVYDVGWRIKQQQRLAKLLEKFYPTMTLRRYNKEKRYFFNINYYGHVIDDFIKNQSR